MTGSIEIGLKWLSSVGLSILGIEFMRPTFHTLGNIDIEIELLMILVSGLASAFAASFMNLVGIRSGLVEQSARSVFNAWKTSW